VGAIRVKKDISMRIRDQFRMPGRYAVKRQSMKIVGARFACRLRGDNRLAR
jgi:hypothetical protein